LKVNPTLTTPDQTSSVKLTFVGVFKYRPAALFALFPELQLLIETVCPAQMVASSPRQRLTGCPNERFIAEIQSMKTKIE
jgi:hypothetical protein